MKIREIIQNAVPDKNLETSRYHSRRCPLRAGVYTLYASRAWTYLSDDPATCVNCHIMGPYYATWNHSSHSRNATCNDCHVPHENMVKKWMFKGMDGMKHVGAFLAKSEPQAIQAEEASAQVIMNNCIRCHTQTDQRVCGCRQDRLHDDPHRRRKGMLGLHRDVPHGGMKQPLVHARCTGTLSGISRTGVVAEN